MIAACGVLAVALGIGGVLGYDYFFGNKASAAVALEATSTTGPAPFTAPVGNDVQGVVAPANATGAQPGNTGGLYSQDPAVIACDRDALVDQLQADPAKAAAWASALGLSGPDQIGPFARSLTPVTLRADTAVTQYGYRYAAYQSYPADLQSGTAVLVNGYGEPTVKCFNGNPLGPPTASNHSDSYTGTPWPGYVVVKVIWIVPTRAPMRDLPCWDPGTNRQVRHPLPPWIWSQLPPPPIELTGPYTADGSMLLFDGSLRRPDGTIVPAATIPSAAVPLRDRSGFQLPDGRVVNLDGSERLPIKVSNDRMLGTDGVLRAINPDGTVGEPVPMTPGTHFQFNYDGSVLSYSPDATDPGQVNVVLTNPDGTRKFAQVVPRRNLNADGSVTGPGGEILNPDGTPRKPVQLPGGVIQFPDGTRFDPSTGVVNGTKVTDSSVPSQAQQQRDAAVKGGAPFTVSNAGAASSSSDTGSASNTSSATSGDPSGSSTTTSSTTSTTTSSSTTSSSTTSTTSSSTTKKGTTTSTTTCPSGTTLDTATGKCI